MAEAADFARKYDQILVLGATRAAADELAFRIGAAAGVHRLTLLQLAADLARPAMADRQLAPLTGLGVEALAARVIHAAREAGELSYFRPVAALPGFARALARTLGELRLAGVAADSLAESGKPGADLARLLHRYEEELEQRSLADLALVLQLASEESGGASRWVGLPLLLLDVPLPSRAHRDFVERLASRSEAVLAAVIDEKKEAVTAIESALAVSAEDLNEPPASALGHLRRFLFAPEPRKSPPVEGAFDFFSAPGEGLETVEIARRIHRLVREESLAFDQVAILLRSPERYQPMVEDALRRAGVPAYFSHGSARPDPGGRAFLALLACASEQLSASRFAEYLSLGQLPTEAAAPEWVPPADEMLLSAEAAPQAAEERDDPAAPPAPAGWEKLLVDAAVIGGRDRWVRRLRGLEKEFELRLKTLEREDEARRRQLARQLDHLRHLENFALPLIEALDALPRSARWSEWQEHLTALARRALRRPEPVLEALAEFEPMGDVGPASLEEVAEVLSERLRFLRREPPERRWGQVFVGSIDEARGREFAVVFLPGLAEGLFPQRQFEDPLLLDEFRSRVSADLLSRDDRVAVERLRLRIAAAAARDRLIASYPRMDVGEARPRVPSFYALELPRAIEGGLPELEAFEKQARDSAPARLNWPAPKNAAEAIDDAEYDLAVLAGGGPARHLLLVNDSLKRSLRGRWQRWHGKWTEVDGLVTTDVAALAALAEHRLTARAWSASSLQHFAACPYRFALHGIYQLRPREEAAPLEQMDPLTRGGLFHAVQFALLGELRSAGLLPVNAARLDTALTIADQVLGRVADRYAEDLAPAIPRVWQSEVEDLRTDLRGWLQHVAVNDDDWEPRHFEYGFGLTFDRNRDPASVAEPVHLQAAGVVLRGAIDLVERNTRTGALRVTDHKTGRKPDSIPLYVGGGKFLQPLLYALAAEKLLGLPVESGRLFYATQRGEYMHALIHATPQARLFLARLVENIDSAIATGFLPPAPQKDVCGICDYRVACGPYEERRVGSFKDRRDERLEPLTEIRAMI